MTPRSAFVSILARERLLKKLSRALCCCSPEGVHALGPRNLVMPQLHVLPFLVSWFYSPSPLILSPDMPPGLPMTCSATKHSEIVDSSFSEYAFWLDTQIQRPFSLYHTQRLKRNMSLEIEAFKKNHKFGKSGIRFNLQTILLSTLSLWSREVLSIQSVIPLWWKGLLDYSPPDP